MKCQECGFELQWPGEYHPHAFCVLVKAGIEPLYFIREAVFNLGLLNDETSVEPCHKDNYSISSEDVMGADMEYRPSHRLVEIEDPDDPETVIGMEVEY